MKIYRVHTKRAGWESDGFEFFLKRMDAAKRLDENDAEVRSYHDMEEQDAIPEPGSIDVFEFKCSKQGIMELLKQVAAHPDNG